MRSKLDNPVLLAALGAAGLLLEKYRESASRAPAPAAKPHAFRRRAPEAAKPSGGREEAKAADQARTGWWSIIKRVGKEISDNQLMTQAAAITFYALLSIFPALAAMVSIYGLVADPATIVDQVNALSAVLPGGGQQLLSEQLKNLASASGKGLGWGLVIGLATSLWTANNAMKALFNALNAVHEVDETRGFIKLTALTLACTVGIILFLIVALIGVVVIPAVLNFLPLGGAVSDLINWLRWPALLIVVAALLAVLYRYGPSREDAVWRWISYGSAFAAISWVIVSLLFSWYVANFGSYNKTYGALGAVIGFMTWIWLSSTVVLVGAQLDAELEKATPSA